MKEFSEVMNIIAEMWKKLDNEEKHTLSILIACVGSK